MPSTSPSSQGAFLDNLYPIALPQPLKSADRFSGLRYSAAFFSSLRANLRLHEASGLPSPVSTPILRGSTSLEAITRQPSPLRFSATKSSHLPTSVCADPPPRPQLSALESPYQALLAGTKQRYLDITSSDNSTPSLPFESSSSSPSPDHDISQGLLPLDVSFHSGSTDPLLNRHALRLLSSTIRTTQILLTVRALLSHPLVLAQLLLAILLARVLLSANGVFLATSAVLCLTAAIASLWLAWPYLSLASAVTRDGWLADNDELIIATAPVDPADSSPLLSLSSGLLQRLLLDPFSRFSTSVIGARSSTKPATRVVGVLVYTYRLTESGAVGPAASSRSRRGRHHTHSTSKVVGRGLVRGWAVASASRGQNIGVQLLREAAQAVFRRGGESIEFAAGHAFADCVVPGLFGRLFEARERRAREKLAHVAGEVKGPGPRRRRRTNS